ncbi:hypothetical protein AF332_07020 [Sporosarcina globispora]|uniref:Uncharacterized protein n=1 Tax=Sporosarcina globispora TaxID=1459 RepID=A0A0M0GA16_SPOGL|nr:hypothetical protein [Sporosarcina globispora]KON86593.1 hypothetical protein AF332_07020 [Sporosarcina globispora]
MENKQYWGVCVGEGKEMDIVRVFSNYDQALEESAMFTLETGISHDQLIRREPWHAILFAPVI